MSYPTPHTVQHAAFNGTGQDSRGNDTESWAAPVPVKVICYQPSLVESRNGYTSRMVADIDMAVPPGRAVSVRDKFALPDIGECEVVAVEDATKGPFGWQPGKIVKLKQVSG